MPSPGAIFIGGASASSCLTQRARRAAAVCSCSPSTMRELSRTSGTTVQLRLHCRTRAGGAQSPAMMLPAHPTQWSPEQRACVCRRSGGRTGRLTVSNNNIETLVGVQAAAGPEPSCRLRSVLAGARRCPAPLSAHQTLTLAPAGQCRNQSSAWAPQQPHKCDSPLPQCSCFAVSVLQASSHQCEAFLQVWLDFIAQAPPYAPATGARWPPVRP